MNYSSYAELFAKNPTALEKIKEVFGQHVYTDDNEICDPAKDPQTVATVALYGNELCVNPLEDDGPADFVIEL